MLALRLKYSEIDRSMSWMLMFWPLALRDPQQPWYWLWHTSHSPRTLLIICPHRCSLAAPRQCVSLNTGSNAPVYLAVIDWRREPPRIFKSGRHRTGSTIFIWCSSNQDPLIELAKNFIVLNLIQIQSYRMWWGAAPPILTLLLYVYIRPITELI